MDFEGSLEVMWIVMENCVVVGKVKAFGVVNFSVFAVERLMKYCIVKFVVNEVELYLFLV